LEWQNPRVRAGQCELTFRSTISNVTPFLLVLLAAIVFIGIIHFVGKSLLTQNQKHDLQAKYVEAIHASVKRYKNLYQSNIGNTYYWTAHSKRYVLKISLSAISHNKFVLNVNLEGSHQQNFNLGRPGWLSSKIAKMESKLYFASGPLRDAGVSRLEVDPFLDQLDFFDKVTAREGILSGTRTLRGDTSMENWPQALGAFIRLASFLMDTGLRKEILAAKDVLCPYCRSDFNETSETVSCRDCKTRHHKECWEEVGRCSVFGCNCKSEIIVTQL
jgi:Prokaryotic RING finger family 1